MATSLRSDQGHMSVDSAEEFISIYVLGRERVACVVLWSSVTSAQNSVFRPLGDDRECQFSAQQPPNVFLTSLIGARHKSPAVE